MESVTFIVITFMFNFDFYMFFFLPDLFSIRLIRLFHFTYLIFSSDLKVVFPFSVLSVITFTHIELIHMYISYPTG